MAYELPTLLSRVKLAPPISNLRDKEYAFVYQGKFKCIQHLVLSVYKKYLKECFLKIFGISSSKQEYNLVLEKMSLSKLKIFTKKHFFVNIFNKILENVRYH